MNAAATLLGARTPVIKVEQVTKTYGHVQALRSASLEIFPGEVVGLVGDNGAGKSTMAKVISGEISPDGGTVSYSGEISSAGSIRESHERGIELVYQDLALAPDLTIAENMFLGRELRHGPPAGWIGGLDRSRMLRLTRNALDRLGVANLPSLHVNVRELSGGQQQAIAVARAVMWATRLVVMDEPTAALGVRQTAMVYDTVAASANQGLSVLVISHDIPKMIEVADRIFVMRHGTVIADVPRGSATLSEVISLMLGDVPRTEKSA